LKIGATGFSKQQLEEKKYSTQKEKNKNRRGRKGKGGAGQTKGKRRKKEFRYYWGVSREKFLV